MIANCSSFYSRGRTARLATFAIACAAAWSGSAGAQPQENVAFDAWAAAVTPNSQFQYSALTGSGNTVLATRVPVVTSTGAIVYKDVTLLFAADANGGLTLAPGYPHVVDSPNLLVSSFKPGNYVGPSTILSGKAKITVSGPGITSGGVTAWSLAAPTGADYCTYPSSATWYVGSIASNPLAARLKAAGITSTAWSYGVGNSRNNCYSNSGDWQTNTLIGLSQIGNTITIVSFTNNGKDYAAPQDQITYTLAP